MSPRRALIVDDERLARRDLSTQLAAFAQQVEVVGEATSVASAVHAIQSLKPDLAFLDVRMPDGSGFDVLARLARPPRAIFVTAFDRYAVRAFEVNALDYLLKPVDPERLREALARLDTPPAQHAPLSTDDRFVAMSEGCAGFVAVRAIRRISTHGNYSHVHTIDGECFEMKQSLSAWERRLPPRWFVRISRNELVRIADITALLPAPGGGHVMHLAGETQALSVSRRAFAMLRKLMGEGT